MVLNLYLKIEPYRQDRHGILCKISSLKSGGPISTIGQTSVNILGLKLFNTLPTRLRTLWTAE